MSFQDPIVGGTVLRIPAIQSPNYSPGVSGWAIFQNGNAEFDNVTIRGEFAGTDFVIDNAGIFFYSGTPATGNLLISIASASGTDGFGNTYPQGASFGAAGTSETVVIGVTGGSPLLYFLSAIADALNNAALQLTVGGTGTAEHDTLVIKSSQDTVHTDYVAVNLNGNSQDGTTQTTSLTLAYVDTTGTVHTDLVLSSTGITINSALILQALTTLNAQLAIDRTTDSSAINVTYTTTVNATNAAYAYNAVGSTGRYLACEVAGDTAARFVVDVNGAHAWGSGTAARDTALGRSAAGVLSVTTGSFSITTAGQGLAVKEGSNAKQGTATLAAGTVTVSNTSVTANSRIFLTAQSSGASGTPGALRVSARTAGTSFTITSSSTTDTSLVAYQIFEPA